MSVAPRARDAAAVEPVVLEVDGRRVTVSRPRKLLFPAAGLSKLDLARHYQRVGPLMLPHVRERPVSMERYPDGVASEGFFHKDVPPHFPSWIARVRVPRRSDGETVYAVIDSIATLVYLADQACVTPHVWTSRRPALERPDRLIFDLDPPPGAPPAVARRAARLVGDALRRIGLVPYFLATGKRGFHVVAPIHPTQEFEAVRAFARELAARLARRHRDELTDAQRKAVRGGRVYVDVARNGFAQTAVPPYAVRATPQASVAVPVGWNELARSTTRPDRFHLRNVWRRLGVVGDLWRAIDGDARELDDVRRRLVALEPSGVSGARRAKRRGARSGSPEPDPSGRPR